MTDAAGTWKNQTNLRCDATIIPAPPGIYIESKGDNIMKRINIVYDICVDEFNCALK